MPSQRHAISSLVEHEGVVPLPRAAPTAAPDRPAPALAPVQNRADVAFVGTLTAIAAILASRLLLLLAVIGGFVLALLAREQLGFYTLIAYSILIVIPLVGLDVMTRRTR